MIDDPISQFMNRDVLSGPAEMPLREIFALMDSKVQSCFIVCDDDSPVGVISERDGIPLLHQALAGKTFDDVVASDIMTTPVRTLPETATMGEVVQIMNEFRFRRVPIVDDKGQLSGIVNLSDLQTATNSALERRGRDLEVAVMARTAELQAANKQLEKLSIRDGSP